MGTCKLCDKDKKLIKAHIIPASSFKDLYPKKGNQDSLKFISTELQHQKRIPIGLYDKNILCSKCDNLINQYENYSRKILFRRLLKYHPESKEAYIVPKYDYPLLKLFILSILWRSSISGIIGFHTYNLGPYENLFKKAVKNKDEKIVNDISIVFTKFDSADKNENRIIKGFLQTPRQCRIEGTNFTILYLSRGYKILVKIDKRKLPIFLKKVELKENKPLIILRDKNFLKSRELQEAKKDILNI